MEEIETRHSSKGEHGCRMLIPSLRYEKMEFDKLLMDDVWKRSVVFKRGSGILGNDGIG